jgi:hypothetical protein
LEKVSCGIFSSTIQAIFWELLSKRRKSSFRLAGEPSQIQTRHLSNTRQKLETFRQIAGLQTSELVSVIKHSSGALVLVLNTMRNFCSLR